VSSSGSWQQSDRIAESADRRRERIERALGRVAIHILARKASVHSGAGSARIYASPSYADVSTGMLAIRHNAERLETLVYVKERLVTRDAELEPGPVLIAFQNITLRRDHGGLARGRTRRSRLFSLSRFLTSSISDIIKKREYFNYSKEMDQLPTQNKDDGTLREFESRNSEGVLVRVFLDWDWVNEVNHIVKDGLANDKADALRNGVRLFRWVVDEMRNGRKIVSWDQGSNSANVLDWEAMHQGIFSSEAIATSEENK